MNFRSLLIVPVLTLLLTSATEPCAQGMETQLETTFHSMSNQTNPQFINEGRPTASLGSFNFRTPVTRPQLLQFDPPRFSGGCGGIDLYGGSFSYISKEELQGLMRQIAANAKSYAFNLALGAVCNKCLQVMEGLQDKVQKINQMMKSSCDMAQAVVNSAADPMVAQMSGSFQQGAQAARQGGTVSDLWASMNQGWGRESSEAALAREQPDEFARIEPGNIVWRLLKERGVGQWFDQSDASLLIDIQSFLGTVIVCAPNDASACGDGSAEPSDRPGETRIRRVPAVLGLDDLVHGNSNGHRTVSLIECDDTSACLGARIAESQAQRLGLRKRILDMLIGDPERGVLGYVQRARLAQADGSPTELALRSNAPSQFGLLDQAIDVNEHTAVTVAEVLAESMAVEMVEAVLEGVLDAVRQGASQLEAAESAQLIQLTEDASRRLQRQRSGMDARLASRARTLEGLGLTLRSAPTPDLRSGPIAAPGS